MPAPDVLFVTRKWAPAVGGMETWAHQLSGELAKLTSIQVIALPGKPDGHPPGALALMCFPLKVAWAYVSRKKTPDVIHLGDMALWPLAFVAWLRKTRPAIVLTSHGTDVSYPRRGTLRGRLYGAYLRLGARLLRGAVVTTNSRATETVTKHYGWQQTRVIPLATDIRGEVPITPPGDHLLFVGRLVERKGCAWFISNVLPLLPQNLTLRVAGTRIDQNEIKALEHPRVRYLGALRGEQLANAYRQALCVVVPNIEPESGEFEGFGLVACEAAAAGGVVLAANCGGLPAAVLADRTGFLVQSSDPEAWAKAIRNVTAWSQGDRLDFIGRSLVDVEDQFRWPRVASETIDAYLGLGAIKSVS